MRPREGRPRPAWEARDAVRGRPGSGAGAPGAGVTHRTPGPQPPLHPSPPPPCPQLLSPPQPRHPLTGKGSFPVPATGSGPSAGYLLQRRDAGQGPGVGDSPRARRTKPGEEGGRRRLSAPSLLTALPLLRAGASPPAAATAEKGGGGPGRGRGRALTCRRGTRQSSQMGRRCGKWKGEKGGRAMRAVKQLSSNARLSRTALGAPLPRPPTPPAPAMVESAYGECRGPLLCDRGRPRDPCSERLRAAPSALEPSLSPSGGPGTPKLGTADNSVSEKWSQHKDLSLEFYQNYVNILIHHHLLATYFYGLFKRSICISKISFLGHIPFVVGFYL